MSNNWVPDFQSRVHFMVEFRRRDDKRWGLYSDHVYDEFWYAVRNAKAVQNMHPDYNVRIITIDENKRLVAVFT